MQKLLAALGSNIKPSGRDKWICKCPVHNDKDFAMGVKQLSDGSIIANCFSCGANGLDLYKALNLDLDELFGYKERDSNYIPSNIKENYELDLVVIKIYEHDVAEGRKISLNDKRRYRLAVARSKGIKEKYNI